MGQSFTILVQKLFVHTKLHLKLKTKVALGGLIAKNDLFHEILRYRGEKKS